MKQEITRLHVTHCFLHHHALSSKPLPAKLNTSFIFVKTINGNPDLREAGLLELSRAVESTKEQYHYEKVALLALFRNNAQQACTWIICSVVGSQNVLIAYHLGVRYCQHAPPCSRKTRSTKYHSMKSLENTF